MRRVVITGVGVVSPVGSKQDIFWDNIVNGRHGIKKIQGFDTTNCDVKVAAEVEGFDEFEYFDKKEPEKNRPL